MKIKDKIIKTVKEDWNDLKKIKKEILSVNSKELIIKLLNSSEIVYTDMSAVLLIIPEIWKDFELEDWKHIIQNVNRPKEYRLYIDDGPFFEDIRFLYNWIGIDSIELYKSDPLILPENKKSLDKIVHNFLKDTMRDNYKEDFEDGTFGNIDYFRKMKQKLISQGAKRNSLKDI
ncbi:hypothetical protein [uncultured Kordia sp.]|uniref:hypothetical protein n=1 Tax=uncultured Kordia sp. TaxID=507699 RepID=UPI002625A4E3|nr:hypothetical protein [uncultured Kordia sp.]